MRPRSRVSAFTVLAAALVATTSAVTAATAAAVPAAQQPHTAAIPGFAATLPSTPAYDGDAPDPDIVQSGGVYYAFTTGTPLGNYLQALVDSSGSPTSGWQSYTGQSYGSSALPNPPSWEQVNTQTSPGVFFFANHWVMFYDAAQSGHASDSGFDCLSVATTPALSPSNAAFVDSSAGPLLCQAGLGGDIDPSPFINPVDGTPWLLWKSNDGGSSQPARIWSEELDPTGTGFLAGSTPTQILFNNTASYPWEATVENPSMIYDAGWYYLLFSGGIYTSPSDGEGYAVCSTPAGPCTQTDPNPFVSSFGPVSGPGGGSWFQDASGTSWLDYDAWTSGCTSYACGGARKLYVTKVTFGQGPPSGINKPAVGLAPTPDNQGYFIGASDGGIFTYGTATYRGSAGAVPLNQPIVGMAATPDGDGYWLVASDGGIFTYGTAAFKGSAGAIRLNQPIVGMARTHDGGGYWLVASDGGIFTYGDATYRGSTGAIRLNKPIVGMAATPDGGGYWLVASDGGIFSFGDAKFWGSTGAIRLNQPIVGMAATPDGGGYWLVASDGGIFTFGDAGFHGSSGGTRLNKPIVGMAATSDGGGYWLVASDGGVFTFGDAPFWGAPT